jgi:mannose-1-phosphate guanylyltransferase
MIFCLCITGLCCYTVHMLLDERTKMQSALYKTILEVDQIALCKPLTIKRTPSVQTQSQQYKDQTIDMTLMDSKAQKSIVNTYPISPYDKLGIGYGFDMRV